MRFIILATLAAVCCMVRAVPSEGCGPNEQYSECGSTCPKTCDSINQEPRPCSMLCVKGCFCKEGYVRNSEDKCVRPYECSRQPCDIPMPKPCSVNIRQCNVTQINYYSSHCPNPNTKMKLALAAYFAAIMACAACQYVSNCRGPNEVFSKCGSPCPLTCDSWRLGPGKCDLPCQRGCFCQPGFVRNFQGVCIEPAQCPVARDRPPYRSYH
ncbi:mucin-6-like [Wyeomyia smithii]|uniref:mucin-6-like n=1 Tax=Wyeomyia smithii TaxID=174621 RepID=UPI00246802C6|nr:mucin-6-like [Wyeomyia smithii]